MCRRSGRLAALIGILLACTLPAQAQDAVALKARYLALQAQMADSPFGRPLHVQSRDESGELSGEVLALIDQAYAVVGPALSGASQWCEILILHLNVKHCRAADSGDALRLSVGRKHDEPLADTHAFEFGYRVVSRTPGYLHVALDAADGPAGTHTYRIVLEVAALDARRSLLRLSYAYRYGVVARAGMRSYLSTLGRDKVGFSRVAAKNGATPALIGGTRGVIERNTMRYYLAIEVYLDTLQLAEPARSEQRIRDWHDAVERYPRQLHELERDVYLQMKRRELARQARVN